VPKRKTHPAGKVIEKWEGALIDRFWGRNPGKDCRRKKGWKGEKVGKRGAGGGANMRRGWEVTQDVPRDDETSTTEITTQGVSTTISDLRQEKKRPSFSFWGRERGTPNNDGLKGACNQPTPRHSVKKNKSPVLM